MAKSFFEKLTGAHDDQYDYGEPIDMEDAKEAIIPEDISGEDDVESYMGVDDEDDDTEEGVATEDAPAEDEPATEATYTELAAARAATVKPRVKTPQKTRAHAEEKFDEDAEGQLAIDVYETPDEIVIKSTIAGVRPEDVDVRITSDTVTIRGSRKKDEQVAHQNYFYQECYWGTFSRSVILPVEVDAEHAEAKFKNGILSIHLPKVAKNREKRINIISS